MLDPLQGSVDMHVNFLHERTELCVCCHTCWAHTVLRYLFSNVVAAGHLFSNVATVGHTLSPFMLQFSMYRALILEKVTHAKH